MKQFWTGLIAFDNDAFGTTNYRGAGWEAVIASPPEELDVDDPGVHILASSAARAQRAFESVWTAIHVLHTDPLELDQVPEVTEIKDGMLANGESIGRTSIPGLRAGRFMCSIGSIPIACRMAAAASRRRSTAYALHELGISQALAGIHYQDLNPSHWRYQPAVSPYHRDHVRLALAIVAAYSCIEHLGLEVRASTNKPSMLRGKWNPVVKNDLQNRLSRRKIDITETVPWVVRGARTRIERIRPPAHVGRASWSGGWVRDIEMDLIDAIAYASWLRSKIASHKLSEEAGGLTIYDAHNCQQLARRMLMESLGTWRSW